MVKCLFCLLALVLHSTSFFARSEYLVSDEDREALENEIDSMPEKWYADNEIDDEFIMEETVNTDPDPSIDIIHAVNANDLDRVKELLAVPDIDINAIDPVTERSALMLAATWDEDGEIASALLAHPAININLINHVGKSALHYACENSNIVVTKWLIGFRDIDVNLAAKGQNGVTPLMLAARANSVEVTRILLAHRSIDVLKEAYNGDNVFNFAEQNEHSGPSISLIRAKIDESLKGEMDNNL